MGPLMVIVKKVEVVGLKWLTLNWDFWCQYDVVLLIVVSRILERLRDVDYYLAVAVSCRHSNSYSQPVTIPYFGWKIACST